LKNLLARSAKVQKDVSIINGEIKKLSPPSLLFGFTFHSWILMQLFIGSHHSNIITR
jgi:hypothetical protein